MKRRMGFLGREGMVLEGWEQWIGGGAGGHGVEGMHTYFVWGNVMDFEGVQYTGGKLESSA